MSENTFQKFASVAAIVVGLSSLSYGLVFLFLIPGAQKPVASAASFVSFATNSTGRQLGSLLLALGGLAATVAVIGIYQRVRVLNAGWSLLSLVLGVSFGLLTTLQAAYILFLFPALSKLYVQGDAVTKASAVLVGALPSPLDPYGFSKFFLSGIWLLLTGVLMVRSRYFPRLLGYLALLAGVGVLLLFAGEASKTNLLILVPGLSGSAVVGPLFWLWVGYTLWTKTPDDTSAGAK